MQVHHNVLQGLERPEASEEQKTDEGSESAGEEGRHEERPKKDEGDEALHDSAFAISRFATGMDRGGNGESSIKSYQRDMREGCGTARPWEPRREPGRSRKTRDVVFTTLQLLPRSEGKQRRPTVSTFPQLLTEQQARKVSVNVFITKSKSKFSSEQVYIFGKKKLLGLHILNLISFSLVLKVQFKHIFLLLLDNLQ